MSGAGANEFRERARLEADRYGPDPWVFVRELLQNARDAGATFADFTIEEEDGLTRLSCRDDGEGMSFEHARRYLFSLYASSKEDAKNQVGRFGVGFWSVLRFDPTRIVIRSHPQGSEAWEISLDGHLEHAQRNTPKMKAGTQVILERPTSDGAQARRVRDAAAQNARFLCRRDAPATPLRIRVNGESINAEFDLPAPSATFQRGAVRGVVGLGAAPRVELFSRGLRVRSAACFDDLLSSSSHTNHSRVRFPELPGAVAPQALLESEGLDLLLSRSDARENRSLRKLVRLANRELQRLVDRQLTTVRPPGFAERCRLLYRSTFGESLPARVGAASVAGIAIAIVAGRLVWGNTGPLLDHGETTSPLDGPTTYVTESVNTSGGYTDLAARYRGPRVSELDLDGPGVTPPLTYSPAEEAPYLAALVVADLESTTLSADEPDGEATPYAGARCEKDCVHISLRLDAGPGWVRLPVPTGHRLDARTVEMDGKSTEVYRTENDEPALVLASRSQGSVSYATVAAPSPSVRLPAATHGLPNDLVRQARALRRVALSERVERLIAIVQTRVDYSTAADVSQRHREAIGRGESFVERTLSIGSGDCDVQNGLLVALLQAADVPARLAVGYVGRNGSVAPWLHAWAEWSDEQGNLHVADASNGPSTVPMPSEAPGPMVASGTGTGTAGASMDHPSNPTQPPSDSAPSHPEISTPPESAVVAGDSTLAPGQPGAAQPSSVEASGPITAFVARTFSPQLAGWVPFALFGLGLALLLAIFGIRRRTQRSFQLDDSGDLSRLLHGALQRPVAFRHLPSLFQRKLIPLAGKGAVSLDGARALASSGRLFRSREHEGLAAEAIAKGVEVLDDQSPEARTVGDTLGATDLDRWGRILDMATPRPVLDRINACLRSAGERWEVLAVDAPGDTIASLDLRALKLAGDAHRVIVLHTDNPWLSQASERLESRPALAVLLMLDHIAERLNLGPNRRARLLAEPAGAALREARE